MARMTVEGFEKLEQMLKKAAQPEKMAIRAVNEAAPILEKSMKSAVSSAANRRDKKGRPYSTGALEASISATEAKENDLGVYSVVRPTGSDKKGLRNAEKMAYLEYGVASRGQAPHPVRQKAINKAKEGCIQAMKKVIEEEVGKL